MGTGAGGCRPGRAPLGSRRECRPSSRRATQSAPIRRDRPGGRATRVDAHEHRLRIGGADGSLGKHRQQTVGGHCVGAHRFAIGGDHLLPAPPAGAQELLARLRAERSDRSQERESDRRASRDRAAPQPGAPCESATAVEVGVQRGRLLRRRLQARALLLLFTEAHHLVGPQHEGDAGSAEGERQGGALHLRVGPTDPERGEEHERPEGGDDEGDGGGSRRSGIVAAHVRVPMSRTRPRSRPARPAPRPPLAAARSDRGERHPHRRDGRATRRRRRRRRAATARSPVRRTPASHRAPSAPLRRSGSRSRHAVAEPRRSATPHLAQPTGDRRRTAPGRGRRRRRRHRRQGRRQAPAVRPARWWRRRRPARRSSPRRRPGRGASASHRATTAASSLRSAGSRPPGSDPVQRRAPVGALPLRAVARRAVA